MCSAVTIYVLADIWKFPGGKIEVEETSKQALIREISEEIDCKIVVYEQKEDTTYEYPNIIVNLRTYKSKILEGKPVAKEHAEIRWVPVPEIKSLEWAPADIITVKTLLAHYTVS